jgi:G3E family GTPase
MTLPNPKSNKARYIMIGGFLGAGKTTSLAKLAGHLTRQGLRVGLITNDQGSALVDTAMLRAKGFATEEIPGGCFCCRFNSLVDAAEKLTTATRPDVFIAEPVGSCTDLVATVTYPLRRIYGDNFTIAPLSVIVDPVRALRVLGLEHGGKFSDKVLYIYRKQLEEADLIVINKCDLIDATRSARLRQALAENYSSAELFEVSARLGTGLDSWFARITSSEQQARAVMAVDYETYAEGEALLGWLNATVDVSSASAIDGNALLRQLAKGIQESMRANGFEIAHLKMTLDPDDGLGDLGVINLVGSDFVAELGQELSEPLQNGQLILNIRAEVAPEILRDAVNAAVNTSAQAQASLTLKIVHLEYFRPGKPVPTHRVSA